MTSFSGVKVWMIARPGLLAAAGAADDLREQAERALRRAVVVDIERDVGAEDADERDVFKIQALGDHLRAEQDRDLFFFKLPQELFVPMRRADRVGVHTQHLRSGNRACSSSSTFCVPVPMCFMMPPHSRAASIGRLACGRSNGTSAVRSHCDTSSERCSADTRAPRRTHRTAASGYCRGG